MSLMECSQVLTVKLPLVKERVVSGFSASRAVILMSRTATVVGKRKFSKIPNWRHYLHEDSCQTLQTLSPPTTICLDRWHTTWLISISALMKKSKNGSIRGSTQKTHRFFEMVSDNCQNDEKK